jgi:nucleoside-triphosphatase THEP1
MKHKLSETWIKASIAGTIWAASEIVLGSFLHNLRIPFSGNILTAIGLVILISISHIWTEKGIFWRAGLICALMKTMSPSAIIFGPMLGIFAESVLLELSTRLLGRSIAGYATGAMLAMSWNLFQKIGSFIIYYGSNIIEVYSSLLKMAQKQLNIRTDIVWLPIIALLVVYALFGLFSAVIGIKVGKKMLKEPHYEDVKKTVNESVSKPFQNNKPTGEFNYSVTWLFANILLIIASFLLLVYSDWYIWAPVIICIVTIWSLRYKRALRQLSKPKFWIFFVLITLITALVFTKAQEGESYFLTGLLTGIQMNFRAILIIVGFSTLGTELFNPVVRNFFMRTSFKNLPLAMELSAESLPAFIAAIPDFKTLRKNPVSIFYKVISHAGMRFSEIKERNAATTFIVTGGRGQGKTTWVKSLAELLSKKSIKVAGIISERIMNGDSTTGYNITDIEKGNSYGFLRSDEPGSSPKIGKFTILEEGLTTGRKILHKAASEKNRVVIIDEVGRLELNNQGWSGSISELTDSPVTLVLVVRDEFVGEVKSKWHLRDATIFHIGKSLPEDLANSLKM